MNKSFRSVRFILCSFFIVAVAVGCARGPERASTGEYIDDTVLATRVKSALLSDPEVSGLDIQVETFKGRVQLSGFVNNQAQARRAEEIAQGVDGVREVMNETTLK
jgi:hyperosmotically inducible periplasmic protein